MNFVDYLLACERAVPDTVAVRDGGDAWSYATLLTDTRSAANVLEGAGVDAGDAVLVMLPNTYQFVTATLGTLARQGVVVPVNTRFQRREVSSLVERVDPDVAVVCGETLPVVEEALAEAGASDVTLFSIDDATAAVQGWDDALGAASDAYQVPETLGEREAFVLHTSGSTGRPKGVVHTHANLAAISDASIASYEMSPDSVFLAVMPLYHCTGMGTILGATLKVGGELLLRREWEPEAALAEVDRYGVTVFSGVPAMFKDWLGLAEETTVDTGSVETGVIGGAGVSTDLIRQAESLLGCPVLNGWGMTETFAGGLWEDRHGERQLPSVGKATGRLFEARVVDPDTGEPAEPNQPGELLVRGEAMMLRYLDTEAEWSDGWFHTGDYARIDTEGYVFLLDRVDYTIITGGENVYPQEVEAVIEELPGVQEAAVVGKPDERKGEKPVAFVDRRAGSDVTADQVREHVLAELAAFKHPREVTFLDALPRNAVGKVDREVLEAQL
ncbi:MAG: class I adenylate-forming enzyme family protein [Halolamina sp.]